MKKIIAALATFALALSLMGGAATAIQPMGTITVTPRANCQIIDVAGSGFRPTTAYRLVFEGNGSKVPFPVTTNSAGNFTFGVIDPAAPRTWTIYVSDGESVVSNTIVYTFCPPQPTVFITLSTDDSVCGQVTVTATGFGITPNTTYQLVNGNQTKSVTAGPYSNTVSATFATDPGWGNAQIRTVSGGYLAAKTNLGIGLAWYRSQACLG